MTLAPSERNTSSKDAVNLESRSRIRNETPEGSPFMDRFRACWVTHAASGFRVTPSIWTRREPTSMKNKT